MSTSAGTLVYVLNILERMKQTSRAPLQAISQAAKKKAAKASAPQVSTEQKII